MSDRIMKLRLLVEQRMEPMPDELEIVFDWDNCPIRTNDDAETIHGRHIYLKGPEEVFRKWLREFDGIWVGKGTNPQMEEFQLVHIRDDNG